MRDIFNRSDLGLSGLMFGGAEAPTHHMGRTRYTVRRPDKPLSMDPRNTIARKGPEPKTDADRQALEAAQRKRERRVQKRTRESGQ